MTYPLEVAAHTADGVKLDRVMLRHDVLDADKVCTLRANMLKSGWVGRPVILADAGDHHIALTGTHRLAAAQGIDGIEAVWLPDDLTEAQWDEIDRGSDDDDLLAALTEIAEGRDDMADVLATMRGEVEANRTA